MMGYGMQFILTTTPTITLHQAGFGPRYVRLLNSNPGNPVGKTLHGQGKTE